MDKFLADGLDMLHGLGRYLLFVLIGGSGGLVYHIISYKHLSWVDVLKSVVVASFTGLMAGMVGNHLQIGEEVTYLMAGLFGFSGGFGLLWLLVIVGKRLNINMDYVTHTLEGSLIRSGVGKNPEQLLHRLLAHGTLTPSEYVAVLGGDLSALGRELMSGAISGVEYDFVAAWVRSRMQAPAAPETVEPPHDLDR